MSIPSAVKEHSTEAHRWDNVKILDREDREFPRQVKEAIQIRNTLESFYLVFSWFVYLF